MITLVEIKQTVEDMFTTTTFVEARLYRLAALAVSEYSRYNPLIVKDFLTTVADQAEYDLSSLVPTMVLNVWWWATSQTVYTYFPNDTGRVPAKYTMPSMDIINDIDDSIYREKFIGRWGLNNDTLTVYPTPSTASTDQLQIEYATEHVLNDAGTAYETIPAIDLEIVSQLTVCKHLEGQMAEVSLLPDYAEGLQRITRHFGVETMSAAIANLRRGVILKYGSSSVGILR